MQSWTPREKKKREFIPLPKKIASIVKFKDGCWGLKFEMLDAKDVMKLPPKEGKGKCSVIGRFELQSGVDEEGAEIMLNGKGRSVSILKYFAPKKQKAAAPVEEEAEEQEDAEDADLAE